MSIANSFNYAGLWRCSKCRTMVKNEYHRCSFCGQTKPKEEELNKPDNSAEIKLTQNIHNCVEKMNYNAKRRMFAWLEDNIL